MKIEAFLELNQKMGDDILNFANGNGLTERLYDALFSYYCSTNEMPYSVAKARTGDPYEWIDNELTNYVERLLSEMPELFSTDGFYITEVKG